MLGRFLDYIGVGIGIEINYHINFLENSLRGSQKAEQAEEIVSWFISKVWDEKVKGRYGII